MSTSSNVLLLSTKMTNTSLFSILVDLHSSSQKSLLINKSTQTSTKSLLSIKHPANPEASCVIPRSPTGFSSLRLCLGASLAGRARASCQSSRSSTSLFSPAQAGHPTTTYLESYLYAEHPLEPPPALVSQGGLWEGLPPSRQWPGQCLPGHVAPPMPA